ncbi:uncharacterized protein LOC132712918, partial [Ruditapes philippinarum]|uniref:uncharacterized protein LOC132712918 n=1 Tax=Ruditapes philippinarum TaxID=129788 RepID=UPI00295A93CA
MVNVGRKKDVWIKKKPDSVYAKTSPIIVKETVIWTEAKGQTLKRHGKLPAIPDNTSLYYEDKNHYSRINEIEMSDLDDEEYEYKEFHLKKKSASDVTVYDVYTRSKEGMNSTCLEYSEMVKTFRRLIVQNVRVEDVLPSLQFLENHDNIYEERNSSRKKAVEFLLHELEKSEEPGKWQKFIDALRVTGYTYIVDNIQGYKVISHEYQREYVRKLIPKIGKMITPCKVLPHLRCKGLVARCDMEEIEKVSAICSNYAGAKLLLERLLENKKYHNWYVLFIEALQEAGMNEVAMDLEIPALLPGSAQNFTDTDTVYVSENETKENQDGSKKESIQPHTFDKARDAANETHGKEREEHMKTNDSDGKIEEKTRCLEYREMVRIFKPLIVQNLLVHDILPSLPFLENHDEIYEMKNHSAKLAVQVLLDELENCQELGKWEKFISALSDNGYSYIVDNIRGYKFINHFYQREYIKSITPKIGYMIKVCEIIFFVYAKNLISESDKENIQREDANRGNFAAAVLLLDRIHRKHRNWYLLFIEALNEAGMDEVVKCLEIPALLESKRTKNSEVYKQCDGSKGEKKVTQTRRLPPPPPACPVRAGNSDEKYDYSANAHVKEEQQDTDEYTYDDTVQSTYNIPPPTNSFETENSIQSDSEYEQYELNAPPIPPRLLWSGERRDLRIQEADS